MFEDLASPRVTARSDLQDASGSSLDLGAAMPWVGLGALALLLGVGIWGFFWFNRPRLPPEQHARFADELRRALEASEPQNV
jgi:hypothetical protein